MPQVQINFDVDERVKQSFEVAVKSYGFSTMAEAFRDFMRRTVSAYSNVKFDPYKHNDTKSDPAL
jgi:antitoxin component of RelBE/YafQ-DinJ toxin-antitoxin module